MPDAASERAGALPTCNTGLQLYPLDDVSISQGARHRVNAMTGEWTHQCSL